MFKAYCQRVYQFLILIWSKLKKTPSPEEIVDEQLAHVPDQQAARIKRHLQEHREREKEKQV